MPSSSLYDGHMANPTATPTPTVPVPTVHQCAVRPGVGFSEGPYAGQ